MKNFLKKYWQTILLVLCIGAGVILFITHVKNNADLKEQNRILSQNVTALTDSLHVTKLTNGQLLATIAGFEGEIKDLKTLNQDLYNKTQEYKKTTGNEVVSIVTTETVTVLPQVDTVFVREYGTNIFTHEFDFSDSWRLLKGSVSVNDTDTRVVLEPEVIYADITAGLDEQQNVFVTTDNPYIQIKSLTGFSVPKPREKRWGVGVQAGYGYDFATGKFGPQVSLGINYSIWRF